MVFSKTTLEASLRMDQKSWRLNSLKNISVSESISEKLGIDFDGLYSETILNQTWWELNQVSGLGRCPVYGGRRAKKRFCFSK